MPYIRPVRPLTSRRLRGLGQGTPGELLSPVDMMQSGGVAPPPLPVPPGPPAGFQTGYPTTAEIPPAIFTASSPDGSSPILSAAPSSPGNVVQVGTLLTYTAQISTGTFSNLITNTTLRDVIAAASQALSTNWGISVVKSVLPSTPISPTITGEDVSIALVVQLNKAYGQPADVQATINHELMAAGADVLSSSIAVGSNAPGATSWLAENWPWVAIGGAGILFLTRIL